MAVLIGAGATLMAWRVLAARHRHVWTVFTAYVAFLPVFATIYHQIYLRRPTNFIFASAVAEARESEVDAPGRLAIGRLLRQESVLRESLSALERRPVFWVASSRVLSKHRFATVGTPNYWLAVESIAGINMDSSKKLSNVYHITLTSKADWNEDYVLNREIITDFDDSADFSSPDRFLGTEAETLYRSMALSRINELSAQRRSLNSQLQRPVSSRSDQWQFLDFLYFSVITQATIGYGDIIPNSQLTRLVVMLQVILSVALLTIALVHAAAYIRTGAKAG